MKFCSECANPVSLTIPQGDSRPRYVCNQCRKVHYQNPRIVAGSIPVWEKNGQLQVLLCKRAIEPRYGLWTLPGGYMENGESTDQASIRETAEEAGARVKLHELFSLLNVPHVNQVHIFYRASLLDIDFEPGAESLEVKLFTEQEIPWDDLAFPTIERTLRWFFEDMGRGGQSAGLHTLTCSQRTIYNSATLAAHS